jgi:isopentenyl-diphosphate delta-isomerase
MGFQYFYSIAGEMLMQQRAIHKYHSGGLWTNACCSHPEPGEDTAMAAGKRLREEMGFEIPVAKIFDFVYKATFDNGLTEYEFDHVFVGEYEGVVNYDKEEVMDVCYQSMPGISHSLKGHPEKYTAWFHLAFPKMEEWWMNIIIKDCIMMVILYWLTCSNFIIMEGITRLTHRYVMHGSFGICIKITTRQSPVFLKRMMLFLSFSLSPAFF